MIPSTSLRRITASLLAAAALCSGSALSASELPKPTIEIAGAEELKGIKKVAVTSFTVQYVLEQTWDSDPQPLKKTSGLSAAHLLDSAKMQSTADALYREFIDTLKSSGLEPVSTETLSASKAYQTFVSNGSPTPRLEEARTSGRAGAITSLFYTPKGSTMVLDPKVDYLAAGFVPEIADPTLTRSGRISLYTQNMTAYDKEVQKELDAATLHVRIYVPLAKVDLKSGGGANGVKTGLRLGERFTRVCVGNRGEYTRMYLKEPLLLSSVVTPAATTENLPSGVRPAAIDSSRYWSALNEAGSYTLNAFVAKLKESI